MPRKRTQSEWDELRTAYRRLVADRRIRIVDGRISISATRAERQGPTITIINKLHKWNKVGGREYGGPTDFPTDFKHELISAGHLPPDAAFKNRVGLGTARGVPLGQQRSVVSPDAYAVAIRNLKADMVQRGALGLPVIPQKGLTGTLGIRLENGEYLPGATPVPSLGTHLMRLRSGQAGARDAEIEALDAAGWADHFIPDPDTSGLKGGPESRGNYEKLLAFRLENSAVGAAAVGQYGVSESQSRNEVAATTAVFAGLHLAAGPGEQGQYYGSGDQGQGGRGQDYGQDNRGQYYGPGEQSQQGRLDQYGREPQPGQYDPRQYRGDRQDWQQEFMTPLEPGPYSLPPQTYWPSEGHGPAAASTALPPVVNPYATAASGTGHTQTPLAPDQYPTFAQAHPPSSGQWTTAPAAPPPAYANPYAAGASHASDHPYHSGAATAQQFAQPSFNAPGHANTYRPPTPPARAPGR